MDKNKAIYAVVGIIIVIILLLFLMKSREDLAGKAFLSTQNGLCASISPDPQEIPQVLANEVAVFTIEPLAGVTEILNIEGNPQLNLQFFKDANVLTIKPVDNAQITITCKRINDDGTLGDYSSVYPVSFA